MSAGWLFLAAMIVAYGGANLLQSIAAAKTDLHLEFHPRLLLRLGRHKAYLWGIGVQTLGSLLAFVARRDLPLFLVQAAVAAGLGVTALLGVLVLKWRLPAAELVLLGGLGLGVAALIVAAEPAPSRQLATAEIGALAVAIALIAAAGFFAVRLHG